MLHEKPRPIYIRAGISQWDQTIFEAGCVFFIWNFQEIYSRFSKYVHSYHIFNNCSFEWKPCENEKKSYKIWPYCVCYVYTVSNVKSWQAPLCMYENLRKSDLAVRKIHIFCGFFQQKRLNFYRHKKEVTNEDEKYRKLFKLSLNLIRNFQFGFIHFLLKQLANFLVELPFKETYPNSQK